MSVLVTPLQYPQVLLGFELHFGFTMEEQCKRLFADAHRAASRPTRTPGGRYSPPKETEKAL